MGRHGSHPFADDKRSQSRILAFSLSITASGATLTVRCGCSSGRFRTRSESMMLAESIHLLTADVFVHHPPTGQETGERAECNGPLTWLPLD